MSELAELRRKVQQARKQFQQYGGDAAEINLAIAERNLEEYLRDEKVGDGVRRDVEAD